MKPLRRQIRVLSRYVAMDRSTSNFPRVAWFQAWYEVRNQVETQEAMTARFIKECIKNKMQ